jgi:hypothetical protein
LQEIGYINDGGIGKTIGNSEATKRLEMELLNSHSLEGQREEVLVLG